MYLLILVFPLLSFLICLGFGRKVGELGSKFLSCSLVGVSLILVVLSSGEVVTFGSGQYINLGDWFSTGLFFCRFPFKYDNISLSMLVLVLSVSFLVHLFSTSYMEGDPHIPRFMGYLSLFTFFMIVLVTAGNLVQLFIG